MAESKVNIKPLGERVLIKPIQEESRTSSGLYIPDTAKEKPQTGLIVALGKSSDDEFQFPVEVGQKVLFPKYTGTEIKIDGDEHLIMEADDILAVVED